MKRYNSKQGSLMRVFSWMMVLVFAISALQLVDNNANYYQASILGTPQAKPFDGTVTPLEKVPNWVALNSGEYKSSYSDLTKLVALPKYDAKQLATPTENLKWGNSTDDKIRNAKITFSTPYMGSYKLDGIENSGSHLAIDIKTAMNTPVRAIMNGVVDKASNQSTGFGRHIVIKHVNVPSFESASKKETLYSSYSHLANLVVGEGDVVDKGDIIGYTGDSGTATTPHLHFQIDKSLAPWHPFWPFTYKEADDAGVSFFEAVNIGLGADIARQYTVNPMTYVQKYLNATDTSTTTTPTETKPTETIKEPTKSATTGDFTVQFTTQKDYSVGEGKITIIARLLDSQGNNWDKSWSGYIKFTLLNNESTFQTDVLESSDFSAGKSKLVITNLQPGETQLVATFGDKKFYSPSFTIVGKETANSNDGSETVAVEGGIFTDVNEDSEHYMAIKYLYDEKIIAGYPDGSFKPDKKVSRVEALKFITEALLSSDKKVLNPQDSPFSDTELGVWYSAYVATADVNGLVNGYPDKTFRPAQDVNLAEFTKIALNAIEAKMPQVVLQNPYNDVDKTAWYAPFITYAKDKNFLDEDRSKIYPGEAMTRAEVSEFIFRIMVVNKVKSLKYSPRILGDVPGLSF